MEPLKEETTTHEDDGQVLNDEAMKEMSDQLMEKFKENEYQMETIQNENLQYKKDLITLYGLIRSLDALCDGVDLEPSILYLIQIMRGISSEYINEIL